MGESFIFFGLVGIRDIFCKEIKFFICKCYCVGIMVYMLIGDYIVMGLMIVKEVGILEFLGWF